MQLLVTGNAKTVKGEAMGFLTGILHLAPSRLSGFNVCPMASTGCIAGCLNTSGRGVYARTQLARIRKTTDFFNNRDWFMTSLVKDIRALVKSAAKQRLQAVVRLNGTSDIRWETVDVSVDGVTYANIMTAFPDVRFYDYSKIANRRDLPPNYSLTFSRAEHNEMHALTELYAGFNVAVVFRKTLPATWNGFTVVDGTEHDLRFLDPSNVVVGLIAKGRARKDTSGFVVD